MILPASQKLTGKATKSYSIPIFLSNTASKLGSQPFNLIAMQFKIDFNQYVPVQHEPSKAYLAFKVTENKDFDMATDTDIYKCYPVKSQGTINTRCRFFAQRPSSR